MQKLRSGRLTDSQKIERLTNDVTTIKQMLEALLKQQAVPFSLTDTNINESGKKLDERKFSMDSLTHQLSHEDVSLPYSSEADENFTKLIDRSNFETGIYSTSQSRKVSKMSNVSLGFIQEEDGSIERPDSTDFESYSGDSNM